MPLHDPILLTNSPSLNHPSTTQTAQRNSLREIDAKTAQLRTQLADLAAQRESILDSLPHPIVIIPPEIITEIFTHCVGNPIIDVDPMTKKIHVIGGPLVLARVCAAWRALAFSNPSLWSKVNCRDHAKILSFFREFWLPHVGTQPLEILGIIPKVDALSGSYAGGLGAGFLAALKACCTQWRAVDFCFDAVGELDGLHELRGRLPRLRELRLGLPFTPSTTIVAFSDAPQLCSVFLGGVSFDTISLPWAQLTSITFWTCAASDNPNAWLDILRHTPRLESLSVSNASRRRNAPPAPVPAAIRLPRLHTLAFVGEEKPSFDLLDSLALPALRHLALGTFHAHAHAQLPAFLARSACSLHSISFHHTALPDALTALHLVPGVTAVTLTGLRSWTDADYIYLFDRIARGSPDSGFLPNLRALSLATASASFPYPTMIDMLQRRCRASPNVPSARLENFELVLGAGPSASEDLHREAQVREAGRIIGKMRGDGCKIEIQGFHGLNSRKA